MIFVVFLSGSIRHYFPSPGRRSGTVLAHITGVSPLRGSLRAAPIACVCGWAGVSLCADGVIAKQLARAVLGWMGTAGHLIWPSLITETEFTAIHLLLQVVLAHPPHRFPVSYAGPSGNVFQLPDMTAGPRYLSKSRERSQVCPLIPLLQPPEPETDIIFSKIPKQIFQRLLSASEQSDH